MGTFVHPGTRTTLRPDYTWEVVDDISYMVFKTEQEAKDHQAVHGGKVQRHLEGEGIPIESWAEVCRQNGIFGREVD